MHVLYARLYIFTYMLVYVLYKVKSIVLKCVFLLHFTVEIQSFLSVWDTNLPHEVQNLRKHNEIRQELAEKARGLSQDF